MKRPAAALLLAAAAACAAPAPAAAPPPALELRDVPPVPAALAARLEPWHEVAGTAFQDWMPDGALLVSRRAGALTQLHLVRSPGADLEPLTRGDEPVARGIALPDGDVVFSRSRGGDENYQLYRLDRKRGAETLLTDGRSRNVMGPLSRKGDRLVFASNRANGRDMDLHVMHVPTGQTALLLEGKGQSWAATDWSADDAKLALLRFVSVAESHPAVITVAGRELAPQPFPGPSACASLRFGPGGKLVLASDRDGEFRRLLVGREWAGAGKGDVEDVEVHGDRVAYVTNEDGASRLRFLGEDAPVELPLGLVSGIKFSPDGRRLAFTLSRADAPSDAYTWDLSARRLERWTTSPTPGLDPGGFVVPERISWRSFDGREIPGYLYRPARPGKVPVVITIHGGPEAQYRPAFSPAVQSWVSELGCAVIAPNVRGSTGYGKTYASLDNAAKREDAVKDIGALLDWIAKDPALDASRVAVHGGSYGGYLVLASLVHYGDRIKAGIDVVGIANFRTFLERTSGYRVDLRRVEYGDERDPAMAEVFERISPANHADRIRSALLVAHGRNDPRVPFAEAEQIAAKVRANGRPVWTVYAANEGHGFARKENRDYVAGVTALFLQRRLID
jgi:dipeptidyl aminopeptidase/acylaminoacyl peptidase